MSVRTIRHPLRVTQATLFFVTTERDMATFLTSWKHVEETNWLLSLAAALAEAGRVGAREKADVFVHRISYRSTPDGDLYRANQGETWAVLLGGKP